MTTTNAEARVPKLRVRRARRAEHALTNIETISLVCRHFCRGRTPSQIAALLDREHGLKLTREQPYRYLRYAAERGWLHYTAPPELALREQLGKAHPWLSGVDVSHTATSADVARRAAATIVQLLRSRARRGQEVVRVGFAGGHAMRSVARRLADLFREPAEGMPQRIVFHALVSGFDVENPTTDPKSFFSYLYDDTAMPMRTDFMGLHAPPVVETKEIARLRKYPGIRDAFDQRDKLDIIVTSGGSWRPPCDHSMLRRCYSMYSQKCLDMLLGVGCIGDILWCPINAEGPIDKTTKIRAMTLIELKDLPPAIERGADVVFMLGPCGQCHRPRGELLRTILGLEEHLITHLVTDSRTAAAALA